MLAFKAAENAAGRLTSDQQFSVIREMKPFIAWMRGFHWLLDRRAVVMQALQGAGINDVALCNAVHQDDKLLNGLWDNAMRL